LQLLEKGHASKIGLVPCAFGGAPLSRWEKQPADAPEDAHADDAQTLPANPGVPGDLYARAWRRGLAALAAHPNAKLRGFLWHQGESDTVSEELAASYEQRLTKMSKFTSNLPSRQ
jgi:hypothetical protein